MTPDLDAKELQHMAEMFGPAELHPDLVPHIYEGELGMMLHHPLVIQMFFAPHLNKMSNRQYEAKLEAIERATANGDYHSVVFLHERPYRLDAFQKIAHCMDDQTYWETLANIWLDTESLSVDQDEWQEMLEADRSHRDTYFMDEVDWASWAEMPDPVAVYRGYNVEEGNPDGLSWTTSVEIAEWFAKRFSREGRVRMLVVNKSAVVASLLGRGENEVILTSEGIASALKDQTLIEVAP